MKLETRVLLTDLKELIRKWPDVVRSETTAVMDLVVRRIEAEVVSGTPLGVGGAAGLAGSIFGEVESGMHRVTGIVGTPLEYGEVVELGRRPGARMPPVAPIALWAQRKLGVDADEAESVGFAIARKIAVHGFEGAHMFGKAWEELDNWAMQMLGTIPGRVVARVAANNG